MAIKYCIDYGLIDDPTEIKKCAKLLEKYK